MRVGHRQAPNFKKPHPWLRVGLFAISDGTVFLSKDKSVIDNLMGVSVLHPKVLIRFKNRLTRCWEGVEYASLLEEGKVKKTFFNNLLEAISVGVGGRVNCKVVLRLTFSSKSNI